MKYRRPIAGCLLTLALTLARPVAAADARTPPRSPLEGVAALEKPVTYTETKIPLGELVQKVTADTGAKLTAAAEVADEPVAVVVKEMPARELLEQTAELLDYRWGRRQKNGETYYEIWQDLAAKQREAALRAERAAEGLKRLREQIRLEAELAALSPERFQPLLDDAARFWKGGAVQPLSPDAFRRLRAVSDLWSPPTRVLARLLASLSPSQWSALASEGHLEFAVDPKPGEQPLAGGWVNAFRASAVSIVQPGIHYSPTAEEWARQLESQLRPIWTAATGYRVELRFSGGQLASQGRAGLSAAVQPVPDNDPIAHFYGGNSPVLDLQVHPLDESAAAPRSPDSREDPVTGAPRRFQPTVKPRRHPDQPTTLPLRARDLLPDLARAYDVQFLSDAYSASSPHAEELPSGSEPVALGALLDRLMSHTHTWTRRERLIRLRSRTWFFDRPREIPLRLVRRWKELSEKGRAPTLDEYADVAAHLTDLQLESLSSLYDETGLSFRSFEADSLHRLRYELRLYASLLPGQRRSFWSGRPLPARALSLSQRQLFVGAICEHAREPYPPTPPDLSQWQAGSIRLTREPFAWVVTPKGIFGGSLELAATLVPPSHPPAAVRGRGAAGLPKPAAAQPPPLLNIGFVLQPGADPAQRVTNSMRCAAPS